MQRHRRTARWTLAYSALLVSVVGLLAVLFAVDLLAQPTRLQRAAALGVALLAFVWLARRFVLPWLGWRETEVDMALLVQREQQIDTDLVAALQFESPAAPSWGSRQLETAVVDYVAEYGQEWDNVNTVDRPRVRRRVALLAVALLLAIVTTALFPRHVTTFFNRLALGNARYPSATNIEWVEINGQRLESVDDSDQTIRLPFGRPVQFVVHASGVLADDGIIRVTSNGASLSQNVALTQSGDTTAEEAHYEAIVPKLVEGLRCEISLGDAYSDPIQLEAIPLPIVEVQLTDTPPAYAKALATKSARAVAARQISVLEASRVELLVVCANKPLAQVTATVNDTQHELAPQDTDKTRWSFASTPAALANVTEPVTFTVQAMDADGLKIDPPLQGQIRIRSDRKPTIIARCETQYVLPTAKPRIHFAAEDDFGLREIKMQLEIVRTSTATADNASEPSEPTSAIELYRLDDTNSTSETPPVQTSLQSSYALDLSAYSLAPEDQVRVRVIASDYRGEAAGESVTSEPITLNVTDLSGIYAAMYELEKRAYDTTGGLIDRQTETGATP